MAVAQSRLDALGADTLDSIAKALWQPAVRVETLPPAVLAKLITPQNSTRGFGERMAYRIRDLEAHPDSFTPDYGKRYAVLHAQSHELSPHQAYAMSVLLGPNSVRGYEEIPVQADLQFPRHDIMQLATQVEWYFCVGSATGRNGKEYGVELMFFRYALQPPAIARQFGLSDVENQVIELHLGVSEAGGRHYRAKPIVIAGTTGLLSFSPDGVGARLGENRIESLQPGQLFPLLVRAHGTDEGQGAPIEMEIDLTFASGRDRLLQGANGCEPCCGGVGTLYYSIPDLRLDPAKSTLKLQGKEVALTAGSFWFDHQWGDGMLPSGSPDSAALRAAGNLSVPTPSGWDWFMAQFTGNRQLTLSALHSTALEAFYHQTGATPPGTMHVAVIGKYMDPQGAVSQIDGTLDVTAWRKSTSSPAPAQYLPTDTWYPHRWEFRLSTDVPTDIRNFTMVPIVDMVQTGFFANGSQYAEGAVYLRDPEGKDLGRGFAESVAYANTLPTLRNLVGLPATAAVDAVLHPVDRSAALKVASTIYVTTHQKEFKAALEICIANGLR